jgi:hypothetical protein
VGSFPEPLFFLLARRYRTTLSVRPIRQAQKSLPCVAYIVHLIAAFLTNSLPHFVNGVSGRPFRASFVRLQGAKLSSPVTNVLWGWFNFLVAFLLFANVGPLYIGTPSTRFSLRRALF